MDEERKCGTNQPTTSINMGIAECCVALIPEGIYTIHGVPVL